MVTLLGTWAAAGLLLDKFTTAPPAGAALLSVTLPVEEAPPITVTGVVVTELTTADVTVKLADCVPLKDAEIVKEVSDPTELVVTVNVPVVVS
jgi:hypothetical protein